MMAVTGVVKWFNARKGFGFVTPDDGGDDVFVHQSNINCEGFRMLEDGTKVEFEVGTGREGKFTAVNVRLPGGAPIATRYYGSYGKNSNSRTPRTDGNLWERDEDGEAPTSEPDLW
eukprot:GGOE01044797.1.p3 GENE.GGOE01044797.1~~GGOE01044797.1.p3  ORF type:complete len:116 (-),score=16.57 GGOE01044797.1:155-502(-)